MYVMFIGTAGSGKSTLTAAFGRWLEREVGVKVGYVNLDPGCLTTPFKPDFDVRRWFTVERLMAEEGLGPNGAMVKAVEMIGRRRREIADFISRLNSDFTLIDTPGQMEIFVFRETGPMIAESLTSRGRTVSVYLFDPILAGSASGLAVAVSLAVAAQVRLGTPCISVLSKSDMVDGEELLETLNNPDALRRAVESERLGLSTDLALALVDLVERCSKLSGNIIEVSAKLGLGLDRLYDLCHEAFCVCGEV